MPVVVQFFLREMVEMRYKSIFTLVFLIIPFFVITSTSAEIFELVHDYDIDAFDIESADFNNDGFRIL